MQDKKVLFMPPGGGQCVGAGASGKACARNCISGMSRERQRPDSWKWR